MITLYDKGSHIPLLWTHLSRPRWKARAAQRAERDGRPGDGVLDGHQAGRDPPGPAHLRHHLLPGPGRMNVFGEHPFKVVMDYAPQRARGR